MKMTVKRFSSSSARVLLKKVIRKNYEMFRHETSMRKSFFRKATCSSTKKGFLLILFHWKFRQTSRKKKLSKKLLTGLVSMNIFINLADLFQNNLFQNAQCRCIMSNPLENIFPFLTKPFLFNLFSFNWWDLMKN